MSAGVRIEIRGTVQGVGFRPWVYRVAREIGLVGRVRNHPRGVTVEAFGGRAALEALVARLRDGAPAPARVREVETAPLEGEAPDAFVIDESATTGARALSIPPDLATCPECAREIADPTNRRFGYPFTNCTHCGPRFTIATGVPYDRPATTMAPFPMCPACAKEYDDPEDRRFHAQPNACPVCGPRLALWRPDGTVTATDDPLGDAVHALLRGEIVAVKGLGGFHLACDATSSVAVQLLRVRKRRDEKPFAVMVRDLDAARALAELGDADAELLAAPERPIVLVHRRAEAALAREVAPDTQLLGLFLPYTPLHHLLLAAAGRPLVMTSANLSDEPIVADNQEAVARLGSIADLLLVHDREIATRCDDSVARVIDGRTTLLRRSRGYVPRPVALARAVARPVLACGAHLKNTFCIADGDTAYLGPHVGDLENLAALEFLEQAIDRMERVLHVRPEIIAHDLHPHYLSTRYALGRAGRVIGVQHHHAHVASAMAEHGLAGPVIGVAYDGTGWGDDGTAWGGEILFAHFDRYQRLATFRPLSLAGGDAAIRAPWRVALAMLDDAFDGHPPLDELALFGQVGAADLKVVRRMIRARVNAPLARGVGRWFDAVAALAMARPFSRHEGQLAVAWNELAAAAPAHPYAWGYDTGELPEIDLRPMVRAIVADLLAGLPAPQIAARFHDTIVEATAFAVREAVARVGRVPIVLTGGSFANPRLATEIARALADHDVRRHGEVPPGDGGIALGQALIADAIARSQSCA